MIRVHAVLVAIVFGSSQLGPSAPLQAADDLLTVGSTAPPLSVEHWIQDDGGKLKPVTKFEKGKVTIVEFWATWCGPCIQSMPHLADLQKKYADQGVRVVSISTEPVAKVKGFLTKDAQGLPGVDPNQVQTFADLTNGYSLTTDPDRSTYVAYMEAAAQNGIPAAFLVGKDGVIEWLGHPMEIDGPLQAVLADRWDRAAFAKQVREQQLAAKVERDVQIAMSAGKHEDAIKLIDDLLSKKENQGSLQLGMMKLQIFVDAQQNEQALGQLKAIFAQAKDPAQTDVVAWNVYQFAAQGYIKDSRMVAMAVASTKAAIDKSDNSIKSSLLDTTGHLLSLEGKFEEAIAIEKQALEIAGPQQKRFIQDFLKELEEARADADKQ